MSTQLTVFQTFNLPPTRADRSPLGVRRGAVHRLDQARDHRRRWAGCVIPEHDFTLSVMTNAIDGWAGLWVDGAMHILRAFSQHGAPSRKVRDWAGRWWSLWGAVDLVPIGNKVLIAAPGFIDPIVDAGEIEISGRDEGCIALADGYSSYSEPVRRIRAGSGRVVEIWLAASKLLPEGKIAKEMQARYGNPAAGAP